MFPHDEMLPETFFFNVPLCWGWATWKRSWDFFNSDASQLIDCIDNSKKWDELNRFGGNFLESQLIANKYGTLKTWFVKWHASVLMKNGYTLYPSLSLVNNIGFDSSGENNGTTDKFHHEALANEIDIKEIPLTENHLAVTIIKDFYNNLNQKSDSKYIEFEQDKMNKLVRTLSVKSRIKTQLIGLIKQTFEEMYALKNKSINVKKKLENEALINSQLLPNAKLYAPYSILDSVIGSYTYVSYRSSISKTRIGKFCSIGPNFLCGWGIHPSNSISTSPMFYSTSKQNGMSLTKVDKIVERKQIKIGNDVFIGANVTVLDGVTIGDGVIIGAGAVVSKDIPPYAIAVGCPIQIIKYRFEKEQIDNLLKIQWWDFPEDKLKDVEKMFFDVDVFINNYK